ncbi:MAG: hypothetical protein U9R37_00925 [Campylobacterota bacterium]|nr:hypothetical protein [Campylobacterota bacterium]
MRIVATRLHTTNEDKVIDTKSIKDWCDHVLTYCDFLIVVVDTKYLKSIQDAKEYFKDKIQIFQITPWISFTQPLNLLVEKALSMGAKELLFQSIEVEISSNDVLKLEKHLNNDTLVVGAKLHTRHGHLKKISTIDGWNTPWNTLALWDIEKLGLTGFLSISSGNLEKIPGGIEEVVTISLLQSLKKDEMKAKVIELSSVVWTTKWDSKQREIYHQKKMASKDERSQIQLKKLGIKAGVVEMIDESV